MTISTTRIAGLAWVAWLAGALTACGDGGSTPEAGADAPGDGEADAVADATPDGEADAEPDVELDVDVADDGGAETTHCDTEIAALAAELYAELGRGCTVVLRLDHDSLAPLGYQVFCGSYQRLDEATARATAQADTGHGAGGTMMNGPDPEDAWVFYESPGDFGGAAAVSAHTGLTAFGGSIVWMGSGDITYPTSWRDPSGLGSGCDASGGIPTVHGYDWVEGRTLTVAELTPALAVALQTAIPAAFWGGGYVFDGIVIRYPRSVGAFDPSNAEWVVLVGGGWLE